MTTAVESRTRTRTRLPGGRRLSDGTVLYWWAEVAAVLVYYFVYSAIRNANQGGSGEAFTNARRLISLQRGLGLDIEESIQDWVLHAKPIVILANYFYGSLHFVVTIAVGIWLYRRWSDSYPLWRNTLAVGTGLALIGFVLYPLMPPRLLPESYGYVDTLAKYPTFWSFNSGAVSKISNQYAAMPSVHVCWATWCAVVLVPRLRTTWGKALAISYPVFTVIVIVLTANHYVLDAVGGVAVLAVGYPIARALTRAGRRPPVLA